MKHLASSIIGFTTVAVFMFPVWSHFSVAADACSQPGTQFKDEELFCGVLSDYNMLYQSNDN